MNTRMLQRLAAVAASVVVSVGGLVVQETEAEARGRYVVAVEGSSRAGWVVLWSDGRGRSWPPLRRELWLCDHGPYSDEVSRSARLRCKAKARERQVWLRELRRAVSR